MVPYSFMRTGWLLMLSLRPAMNGASLILNTVYVRNRYQARAAVKQWHAVLGIEDDSLQLYAA